jgi:hypothetical protein
MGLEDCPECNGQISQNAHQCVHCGHRLRRPTGVDKGFHFVYWGLSYRRKFIRTLWIIGVTPLILLLPIGIGPFSPEFFFILTLTTGILQLIYTYVMWKDLEG